MNDSQITALIIGLVVGIPWLILVIYLLKRWLFPPPIANQYIITNPVPNTSTKRILSRSRPVVIVVRK